MDAGVDVLLGLLLVDNKERIAKAGGIKPLIDLASSRQIGVAVEAIAALANLAVNGNVQQIQAFIPQLCSNPFVQMQTRWRLLAKAD